MKKIFSRFKSSSSKESQSSGPPKNRDLAVAEPLEYEIREKDLPKLHKAVWNGDLVKVKQLAKKDPNALDKENRTPLHLAVVRGYAKIVQELLEWNAKTNLGDNQAKTPLIKAVECNKEECVRLLLEYKASVDVADKEGSSSLHYAVREGYTRITAELIKAGAAINKKNKQGYTPLHVSVTEKRDEVTRLLLENKADPNVTDNILRPPISYACQDGSITQVKLLLQAGADPTIKDSTGWLPEDLAESHGHHGCSQLIRDHNTKMMRSNICPTDSTSTTPRTPGSSVATPRAISSNATTPCAEGGDSGLFGLPSVNKEDSTEESTDVMSGHKTDENYWADDTDISLSIDEMMKDQHLFTAKNIKQLSYEVRNIKKENDQKLEAMNSEIYNFKTLLSKKENEIDKMKESNPKKEAKIEKLSNDFRNDSQQRKHAEMKLKTTEGELGNSNLINLSSQSNEIERLLREATEFKLRKSEEELAIVLRENTELLSSRGQKTEVETEGPRKEVAAHQERTPKENPFARTENAKSVRHSRQSEHNTNMILPEVEPSSYGTSLEQHVERLKKQLEAKSLEGDELERKLKTSSICSLQ